MRKSLLRTMTVLVVLLVTGSITGAAPKTFDDSPSDEPPRGLRPGTRIEDHGVAVIVPVRGRGVWVHAKLGDGATQELGAETLEDGTVLVSSWGDEASEGGGGGSSQPPCSDDAKQPHGWKWFTGFRWHFNPNSTPTEDVTVADAEGALRRATSNITDVRNDCGFADNVSASASYQGRLVQSVQINDNSTCQSNGNGTSVVGFGNLASNHLGFSCVWFIIQAGWDNATESDVRLNKTEFDWIVNIGPTCLNRWSVETVSTHERGHTFGLDHVSENEHGNLTMSRLLNGPCQEAEKTLGYGDVLGLEEKY